MSEILSQKESTILLGLCRARRLFEIQKWIGSGKSLGVAIECKENHAPSGAGDRFHSLVELIARRESDQATKDAALREAVALTRLDLVKVLLANGVDSRIDFAERLCTTQSVIAQLENAE
jgi:hypothetical protein